MIFNLNNEFIKFSLYFDQDFDISKLQEFLSVYGLIEKTNNLLDDSDLCVYFFNENNSVFDTNKIIIDNHIIKYSDNKLFVGIKNYDYNEIIFIKRILIDLINRFFEKKGGLFLHSSSIVDDGNSILFIGDKGVGKTTNMLYMLNDYNLAYSSNERTGLIIKNDEIISYGNPARINIRENTLNLNPELRKKIDDCLSRKNYNSNNIIDSSKNYDERLVISFNDLSNRLEIQIIPTAKLKIICNLINQPNMEFYAEKTDYNEISNLLKKSMIDGVFPQRSLLNNIFQIQNINYDNLLKNEQICYYNIYQDGKTNNSEKIYKILKKELKNGKN